MKTTLTVQTSKSAVRFVSSIIKPSRKLLPILAQVHCYANGHFKMAATDLDMMATAICPATSLQDGTRLIPAQALRDAVAVKGEFEIEAGEGDSIQFRSSGNVRSVSSLPIDQFPPLWEIPARARVMTFPAAKFLAALRSVADAISTDESRYVLNSVCVDSRADGVRLVATNGRVLFLASLGEYAADENTLAAIKYAEAERIAAHTALDAAANELAEIEKTTPPQYSYVGKIPGYSGREFYEKIANEAVTLAASRVRACQHAADNADEAAKLAKTSAQILIPAKAIKAILAMPITDNSELPLKLAAWTAGLNNSSSPFAAVTCGDYSLVTKQIEGNFPNYVQVIPQNLLCSVSLPCVELAAAVKQAAAVCTDKSKSVKLTLSKNLLRVSASSELGKTDVSVAVNYHDKEMCIAIDPEYIIDAANAASVGGACVQIDLIDEISPAVFRNTSGWQAVVMPMRLS